VPDGGDAFSNVGGTTVLGATTMSTFDEETLPAAFVALTLKVKVFAVVGVPDSNPFADSVKPFGNPPDETANVGDGYPEALNWYWKGAPTVPSGGEVAVSCGGA
jgi:hypothetical protein